jgi:hypothetical protein
VWNFISFSVCLGITIGNLLIHPSCCLIFYIFFDFIVTPSRAPTAQAQGRTESRRLIRKCTPSDSGEQCLGLETLKLYQKSHTSSYPTSSSYPDNNQPVPLLAQPCLQGLDPKSFQDFQVPGLGRSLGGNFCFSSFWELQVWIHIHPSTSQSSPVVPGADLQEIKDRHEAVKQKAQVWRGFSEICTFCYDRTLETKIK